MFIGGEYYLPLYLQSTHEASPLRSGVLIMPVTICEAVAGMFGGFIMHEFHAYRELILAGTILMTLGTGLYISFGATTSIAKIVIFEIIGGLGCGLLFQPPVIAIQVFTAQDDIATATATQGFIRNMATSFGVVIGGIVFQNSMSQRAGELKRANIPPDVLRKLSGGDAAANVDIVSKIQDPAQKLVVKQAFAWSIRNMWIFYTCIGALGVVAAIFVKRARLSEEHVETRTGLLSREKEGGGTELEMRNDTARV